MLVSLDGWQKSGQALGYHVYVCIIPAREGRIFRHASPARPCANRGTRLHGLKSDLTSWDRMQEFLPCWTNALLRLRLSAQLSTAVLITVVAAGTGTYSCLSPRHSHVTKTQVKQFPRGAYEAEDSALCREVTSDRNRFSQSFF